MSGAGGPADAGPSELAVKPVRSLLFAIEATPGVWLGIAGYATFLVATFLPWYNISAQAPGTPYSSLTTILQFDGLNGLYVDPALKATLNLAPPTVPFPVGILFVISALLKVRKLIRSSTNKMRAGTLFRSSIYTAVPAILTILLITQVPHFVPGDAPSEVQDMAREIGSRPLGGSQPITFHVPLAVVVDVHWGFGIALPLMVFAAVMMNLGSQLELRFYRRAHKDLVLQQAEK